MISALRRATRSATAAVATPSGRPHLHPSRGARTRLCVSGLAPQAAQLAGRVGDGYLLAMPDGDLVRAFRAAGAGHKPVQAGMEVNWDADRDVAAEVAHRPVGHVRAAVGDQRQASAARPTRPYRGQETSLTPSRWYRLARSPRPSK